MERKGSCPWEDESKCQLPRVSFSGLLSPGIGRNGDQGLKENREIDADQLDHLDHNHAGRLTSQG